MGKPRLCTIFGEQIRVCARQIFDFFAKFIAEGAINERKNRKGARTYLGDAVKNCTKSRDPLLIAKGIHKRFTRPKEVSVLKGIDLTLERGESIAIVGRSGEGKSTLLNILGTLEKPTHGALTIDGEQTSFFNTSRLRNQKIGFVFQAFHLLEDYTVLENILFPAAIARYKLAPKRELYKRAEELLDLIGLGDRKHFMAKLLSGGEKQRVAIARAFLNDPAIIMADEPTGNLDEETSDVIHSLLFNFVKNDKACIIVTHNQKLARECSRTLVLQNGRLE
jgi:ABC-type lipoprotein export system ATPase subunit